MSELKETMVRDRALAAYEEQGRQASAALQAQEADGAIRLMKFLLRRGIFTEKMEAAYLPGGFVEADGLLFKLRGTEAHQAPYLYFPCGRCGEVRPIRSIDSLADVGVALVVIERETREAGSLRWVCPVCLAKEVAPASAERSLGARLVELLREVIRDEAGE